MKKILLIVLDGLSDLPIEELSGKTPLESAVTPWLDKLAQQGVTGCAYPVEKDFSPESDVAVINLLGYDSKKYYTGRGPIEAAAVGLAVSEGTLAVRMNFATVGADGMTLSSRRLAHELSAEEALALEKEINGKLTLSNATFEFKASVGHRAVLVMRGMHAKLSGEISNTDPGYARAGLFSTPDPSFEPLVKESQPLAGSEDSLEAKEAAMLLNEFTRKAHQVLKESSVNKKRAAQKKPEANILLARGAGSRLPAFAPIEERYHLKFGCFVEMPVETGIARLMGMEIIDIPSSTGHLDVDYAIWAKITLDAISKHDGLYVHVKGPDDAAHDGDFQKKLQIIQTIDKFYFGNLIPGLALDDYIICVTADHSTISAQKAHSALPVPVLAVGAGITPDGTMSFSEKSARLGSLGQMHGSDIMPLLVKFASKE